MSGAFPIRLIALDIDGTLVGPDLVLGERTIEAVRAARALGVRVSLVTGRMASSAMRFVAQLGLDDPVVAYQGALIRAMPARDRLDRWRAAGNHALPPPVGRALLHTPLPAAVAREAVHWSRAQGLDPHANHLERFIVRADDSRIEDYSAFMGARAELVPDLPAALTHPVTKVLAVGEASLPIDLLDVARRDFAGRADATISHPRFLEFVAPGVSKGRALRWLARRAGVPMPHTLAIGDQWNDLEMLALAGHGVAMTGAPIQVRAAATYLAPPVALEGAAMMIEALVLAGRGAQHHARRLAAEARRSLDEADRATAERATA